VSVALRMAHQSMTRIPRRLLYLAAARAARRTTAAPAL